MSIRSTNKVPPRPLTPSKPNVVAKALAKPKPAVVRDGFDTPPARHGNTIRAPQGTPAGRAADHFEPRQERIDPRIGGVIRDRRDAPWNRDTYGERIERNRQHTGGSRAADIELDAPPVIRDQRDAPWNRETYGERIERNRNDYNFPVEPEHPFAGAEASGTAYTSFDHREEIPTASDGHIIGPDGRAYAPGTNPFDIPAVEPESGRADETVIFVNGQGTTPTGLEDDLQDLAETTQKNVVAVYNATEGNVAEDTIDSLLGKFGIDNPATQTTADLVYEQLENGEDVHLVAHSQGAIIVSEALSEVRRRYEAQGLSEAQIDAKLANVTVETFGGAAQTYPDGPTYVHYVNQADFVPRELGLGEVGGASGDASPRQIGHDSHPGRDATVIQFNEGSDSDRSSPGGNDHELNTYLDQYRPTDEADSHPNRVDVPNRTADEYWQDVQEEIVEDVAHNPANPIGAIIDILT